MDKVEQPIVTVVYIHPYTGNESNAIRFVKSIVENHPQYPCNMVAIVNGGQVTNHVKSLFYRIRGIQYFVHDNSGWDIGGYLALAKSRTDLDLLFCCGSQTTFTRPGWLKRIMEAYKEYGPGMYGTNASYEVRPHLNTSGFLIARSVLATYPHPVTERLGRYEFEWGKGAMWRRVRKMGLKTMLVTWDGVWYPEEWRLPRNVYRDGNQSNCLAYFAHSHRFNTADPVTRKLMTDHCNGLANSPPCKLAQEVDAASPERKLL